MRRGVGLQWAKRVCTKSRRRGGPHALAGFRVYRFSVTVVSSTGLRRVFTNRNERTSPDPEKELSSSVACRTAVAASPARASGHTQNPQSLPRTTREPSRHVRSDVSINPRRSTSPLPIPFFFLRPQPPPPPAPTPVRLRRSSRGNLVCERWSNSSRKDENASGALPR